MSRAGLRCLCIFLCVVMPACSFSQSHSVANAGGPAIPFSVKQSGHNQINHIVVIVQENRSLDNLFNGFPGADTSPTGETHTGRTIRLSTVSMAASGDPCHFRGCFEVAYDHGKMDGFDLYPHGGTLPYAKVPQSESALYWSMAQNYTLADRMFESIGGPSFPAHLYLIGGQSDMIVSNVVNPGDPQVWGCDSPRDATTQILLRNGKTGP